MTNAITTEEAVFIKKCVADKYSYMLTDYFIGLITSRVPLRIVDVTDIKPGGRYRLTLTDGDGKTFSVKSSWVEAGQKVYTG